MNESRSHAPILIAGEEGETSSQVRDYLDSHGWSVESPREVAGLSPLSGIVFDPGLLDGSSFTATNYVVEAFESLIEGSLPRLLSQKDDGARIVVLGSRDSLGAPGRASAAATSGALVSSVRSLALELGGRGITVNMAVGLPELTGTSPRPDKSRTVVAGNPRSLQPWPVTVTELAATVEFFLDARSSYITGQIIYCCGGANLLSSLSA